MKDHKPLIHLGQDVKRKPELHLAKAFDAQSMANMIEAITGKRPTPEEIAQAQKELDTIKSDALKKRGQQ